MILTNPGSRNVLLLLAGVLLVLLIGAGILAITRAETHSEPEQIQVTKVWTDRVDSPPGMVYYLLDVNASTIGPFAWNLEPSLFSMTTNASLTYYPTVNYNETAVLRESTMNPGRFIVGEVVFDVPLNQIPTKLSYADPRNGISIQTTAIPAGSGTASRFDPSVHFEFNGTSAANAVATWAGITNQTNGLAFFAGGPGSRNYSFVFFTGEKIYVTFAFYYYRFPYDPNSIVVKSISSEDGYVVSDVLAWQANFPSLGPQQLPVTMTGYGSNVEVTLLVTVPPGPQYGVLHFTVQWSDL